MSNHQRVTRRTAVQLIGSASALMLAIPATTAAESDDDGTAVESTSESTAGATRYIGVVDRIVDGEHVVLLLEKDGELVDEHVAPRSAFDDVNESDIMVVVLKDDELLTAQQLPKRPGESMPESQNRPTASDLGEELS